MQIKSGCMGGNYDVEMKGWVQKGAICSAN